MNNLEEYKRANSSRKSIKRETDNLLDMVKIEK